MTVFLPDLLLLLLKYRSVMILHIGIFLFRRNVVHLAIGKRQDLRKSRNCRLLADGNALSVQQMSALPVFFQFPMSNI